MFVELHMIQNFPPSNLNRDDVGQPKDADFGGVRRARISSQCLKRSIRYAGKEPQDRSAQSLFERFTQVHLANRTKLIVEALTKCLTNEYKQPETQAISLAKAFAEEYAGGMDTKDENKTNVLLYMSEQEQHEIAAKLNDARDQLLSLLSPETPLDRIAAILALKVSQRTESPAKGAGDLSKELQSRLEKGGRNTKQARAVAGDFKKSFKSDTKSFTMEELDWTAAEIIQQWVAIQAAKNAEPLKPIVTEFIAETKGRPSAPDIALFGRMLADKPATNIDAACQVAHAISTHAVSRSAIDYFTAVDDLQTKDQSGASYLDVAYFNSACFYRYARIDFEQLKKNLGDDVDLAIRTVEAFMRASEAAIPSGKKNSYAQECRPSFMLAVLRSSDSQGWSLVNAFEKPVPAGTDQGLVEASVKALCEEFDDHCDRYGTTSLEAKTVLATRQLRQADVIGHRLASAIAKSEAEDETAFDAFVAAIRKPLQQKGVSA